jgi:hypothetical protein
VLVEAPVQAVYDDPIVEAVIGPALLPQLDHLTDRQLYELRWAVKRERRRRLAAAVVGAVEFAASSVGNAASALFSAVRGDGGGDNNGADSDKK